MPAIILLVVTENTTGCPTANVAVLVQVIIYGAVPDVAVTLIALVVYMLVVAVDIPTFTVGTK